MRYAGMPFGMWLLFRSSFRRGLIADLGLESDAASVTRQAKAKYREIIASLPVFEKVDRFKMNIISCAMLSAFLLSLPKKTSVDQAADYYRNAMMIGPMRWFCRMGGKRTFTPKDVEGMKRAAALKAADRNPYSWNMTFHPYPDDSGYEARFTKCGICALTKITPLLPESIPGYCRKPVDTPPCGNVPHSALAVGVG